MAIQKIDEKYIAEAISFIDKNGVPENNISTKFDLILKNGNKYPPKYVLAVAVYLQNGGEINVNGFNSIEARNFLTSRGYSVLDRQEKHELTITADKITSTDDSFTMDNLSAGDNFKPLDTSFVTSDGAVTKRTYAKGERRNSNQTLPRLALQIFEKQIAALSVEEKESFPVCKYNPTSETICGIFPSVEIYRQHRNTIEYLIYNYNNDRKFVLYCWNVFSTLIFVQECLKQFGKPGDCFKLVYREKNEKESVEEKTTPAIVVPVQELNGYRNPYSKMLIESKNIIFRGAPGTGKTYLAKEIATDIISNGYFDDYTMLSTDQKAQVEFVQFHPSYDYTDFVEGLRPKTNEDGTMGFELQDGVFKRFVDRARRNYVNSQKSTEVIAQESSVQDAMSDFFSEIEFGKETFKTINGNSFTITGVDDNHIYISIPENANVKKLTLNMDEVKKMLESNVNFKKVKDITMFFGKTFATQGYSYDFVIYNEILKRKKATIKTFKQEELKKYVFIIDEINRGEISKIFGELFFAIDPGYRGQAGEVSTQYANLHSDGGEKFYIPINVYIIGTMNDIDRSVDSFDFAMRRRFRFVELKADERLEMLANLNNEKLEAEAIRRMTALNSAIAEVEGLNENYQIGASYFLKLKTLSFDQLWTDYLRPLLQEYINGMYDEEGIMDKFMRAYGYGILGGETANESN